MDYQSSWVQDIWWMDQKKWISVGHVTDGLKATRDQDTLEVMVSNAIKHGAWSILVHILKTFTCIFIADPTFLAHGFPPRLRMID